MVGSILSQGIPMLALTVLTRVVPAADIGDFYLLLGVANLCSIIAAASLDKAIFSAQTEEEITELLCLAIVTGCTFGLTIVSAALISQSLKLSIVNQTIIKYSFCLVGYSLVLAFNRNLQAVVTYRSQFWLLNKAKFLLVTPAALVQLMAGLLGLGVTGLIYSTALLSTISTVVFMQWLNLSWKQILNKISFATVRSTFLRNRRFIIFSLPSDLINSVSGQLPIFIIAARFGSVSVAMYALVLRVLSIPVGLLGGSVLTVFKDRAGQDYRKHGNCTNIYLKTLKVLTLLSFFPFLGLHLFGSHIVKFLLGEQWIVAGQYVEILSPMLFISFISSPLSYVLYFSKRGQVIDLFCQIVLTIIMCLSFSQANTPSGAILCYSISGSFYYVFYLFMSYLAASGNLVKTTTLM